MIYDIVMARLYFSAKFVDHHTKELINLLPAGHVEPEYEQLDDRYYKRDHPQGDKTSEYTVLVKKQEAVKFRSKAPVASVLRKEILSPFGFIDDYYYYIVQRKRFTKFWHKDLDLPKFERKEGIQIPFSILKHIDKNDAEMLSEIVVVLEDGTIWYAPSTNILEFFRTNKMPLFVNAYATMMTGFPRELFKEKWNK
jgi:hypothetical protein